MKNIIPLILFVLFFTGFFVLRHPVAIAADEKLPEHFELSLDTPIFPLKENSGLSAKTYPVDMLSYGVHFRIPRNYIESVLIDPRDKTLDFGLITLYPDFNGVTEPFDDTGKLTENTKKWRPLYSPNLIKIFTIGGELGKEKDSDYNNEVIISEANKPKIEWQYNLFRSTNSYASTIRNIYFQPANKIAKETIIFCDKNKNVLNTCQVYTRATNNLLVMYQYQSDLLPHWQEIHQKVTNLINSFIVK